MDPDLAVVVDLTEPKHENWPAIIAELEQAGISVYKISVMCNRKFNTVKHWKDGGQPKHYEGELLLSIHEEYVLIPRRTTAIF